jgi:diaminohydroxyphosphoribosylaminopyrimidine deaminase/5-amino-6-(5-phosphoribosylamino)uracil reductase
MTHFTDDDRRRMRRALALAARGQGLVEPNPMVGCVIVRGGRVIGEGYHRRFGGPHAEIDALRRCRAAPRGATVYVTLEPCSHQGKTPPCVRALIDAGVARVVVGASDPNPRVHGRGVRALRRAGIRVDVGLLEGAAALLIAPFAKYITTHRPWVTLKWAQSIDGKIATRTGDSKWITDEQCRRHAHTTRGRVDAILVGVETVIRDDPELTCRLARPRRRALRVVLDTHLRTPIDSKLAATARRTPTWIFCGPRAPRRRRTALEHRGCRVTPVSLSRGHVALHAVLTRLGAANVTNLLVEGGGRVLGAFFDERLGDAAHIYITLGLIGGREAVGALHGVGVGSPGDAAALDVIGCQATGSGLFLSGLLRWGARKAPCRA